MTPEIKEALEAALPYVESAAEPQSVYGFFHGGDPRKFSPDEESSTEEERENHRKACEAFTEDKPLARCCEHIEAGKVKMIITRAPFGLGVSTYQDDDAVRVLQKIKALLQESS